MESREIVFKVKDGKIERKDLDDKFERRYGNKGILACKIERENKETYAFPSFWELYVRQCLFMERKKYLEKLQNKESNKL